MLVVDVISSAIHLEMRSVIVETNTLILSGMVGL